MAATYATEAAAAAGKGTRMAMGLRGGGGAGTPAPRTEPFAIVDGRYTVRFGPFFEGHRLTLIVQARKGPD
jgi:hypothetical protein